MQNQEEFEVGIREYLLKEGVEIKGATKFRISDFIVNEIDENKNIIYYDRNKIQTIQEFQDQPKEKITELSEKLKEELSSIIEKSDQDKLILFINDILAGDLSPQTILIQCPEEKEARTKIHQFIRKNLDGFISETSNDKKNIVITYKKNNKNIKRIQREESFLHCTLWKNNIDTYSALNFLCKCTMKKMSSLGFAGNKDKRGITTQRISIFHGNALSLLKNEQLQRSQQVILNDFSLNANDISLGQLYGNRFSLAIRFIENQPIDITESNEIKQGQIFQKKTVLLTTSECKGLVPEILELMRQENILFQENLNKHLIQYQYRDESINQMKQKFIEDRDFSILQNLPFKYKIERTVIEGLRKGKGNDFLGGFMNLPKNSRELYPHAYQVIFCTQSYLWNQAASERVKQFGPQIVKGDLIEKNGIFEEIQNPQDYKLEDIVIPILGSETQIPQESIIYKIYKQILSEDQVSFESFMNIEKIFHVSGSSRNLFSIPEDVQYSIVKFDDPNMQLYKQRFDY